MEGDLDPTRLIVPADEVSQGGSLVDWTGTAGEDWLDPRNWLGRLVPTGELVEFDP